MIEIEEKMFMSPFGIIGIEEAMFMSVFGGRTCCILVHEDGFRAVGCGVDIKTSYADAAEKIKAYGERKAFFEEAARLGLSPLKMKMEQIDELYMQK